jgi:hypothetical protein
MRHDSEQMDLDKPELRRTRLAATSPILHITAVAVFCKSGNASCSSGKALH